MKVYFVGAGAGDSSLLTVKAFDLLHNCQVCIYAGSLVNPQILTLLPSTAEKYDSAMLTLPDLIALFQEYQSKDRDIIRLHTGEPSLYGAIGEQMDALDCLGINYEIIPGISAFQAAAAALQIELTVPEQCQTVVLTRSPGRTPMSSSEDLAIYAQSSATICLYLSTSQLADAAKIIGQIRGQDCPAAVVYHASWPDQLILRGSAGDIVQQVQDKSLTRTALAIFGVALQRPYARQSKLYDHSFSHGYRQEQAKL